MMEIRGWNIPFAAVALKLNWKIGLAHVQSTRERSIVAVDVDQGPWSSADLQEG